MQSKYFLIVIQFLILCNEYYIIKSKALIGVDIRSIDEAEFPSIVCLVRNNSIGTLTQNIICTGTLISAQDVLTSEQCLYSDGELRFVISAGSHNTVDSIKYSPIWWLSYNQWCDITAEIPISITNDVAIVRGSSELLMAQIPWMPISTISPPSSFFGKLLEVVGCGLTNMEVAPLVKQTVPLLILTNEECETRTAAIRGYSLFVPPHVMCSLSFPFALLHTGDAGGPLIYDDTLVAISIGVSPYYNGNFHPDKVNVHLSIDVYRNFIAHVTNM